MHWFAPSENDATIGTFENMPLWLCRPFPVKLWLQISGFQILRRAHGLLLPRLLSGQVEIKTN
jgi:hypothetical protein